MHRTLRGALVRTVSAAVALGLIAAVAAPAAPVTHAATGDRVKLTPSSGHLLAPGATLSVSIVTNTATPVTGAQASVSFDPAVLQVTAVTRPAASTYWGAAPMFLGGGASDIASANATGKLAQLAAAYITAPGSIPTGSDQVVATVTFALVACPDGGSAGAIGLPIGPADTVLTDAIGNPVTPLPADVAGAAPTCGARAVIGAQPAARTSTSFPVAWTGTPGGTAIAGYDVQVRRAAYNGAFGSPTAWKTAIAATSATFSGVAGSTYCFSARAVEAGGKHGAWGPEVCTAVPLDDRSLTRSGTWSAGTGAAYFNKTVINSTKTTAKAVRTGVQTKRISLLVTTCPTCGSVKVYWGSTLLKKVSLKSTKTVNKKVIAIKTFTSVQTGTLTLKPGTAGKKTLIDGVILSRS
jgi:hypothetical protein